MAPKILMWVFKQTSSVSSERRSVDNEITEQEARAISAGEYSLTVPRRPWTTSDEFRTVLDTVVKSHPEYEVTALLRSVPEGFTTLYPKVKIVRGDYDSADVLREAAKAADVVVHNGNSDHLPSIQALIDGALQSEKKTFLLHLSGTGIIADWKDPTYIGKRNPKTWSDVDDIGEITSLPDDALHRHTDKVVLEAGTKHADKLKTAIICPPDIYGLGRGTRNKHSVLFPNWLPEIKRLGGTFYCEEGQNRRSWVHIDDFVKVYLALIESAVAGVGNADWGKEGYYFASSQVIAQRELAEKTAAVLKKLDLGDGTTKSLSQEEISQTFAFFGVPGIGTYMFGSNSVSRADRATKRLGYAPSAPGLLDSLEKEVVEASQLKSFSFNGHKFWDSEEQKTST